MRRILPVTAVVLGVLLVVGAALVKWVAAPALVKAPLSIDRQTIATGSSQVFVLSEQAVKTVAVTATRTVRGDKKAGTGSVAVYDETLCLIGTGAKSPDKDGCVTADDPAFIQKTTDRIAFDRKTALAVSGSRFGANVDGDKTIAHDGLGYTFPIDTKKKDYPFFDTVLGKAFPMRFAGTEKVAGLNTYQFVQDIPSSDIKINGLLPGKYTNTRTVWVEPTTGVIVKGAEKIGQRFASGNGIAFAGTLTFTDATVKSQAEFAKDQLNQVRVVRMWAPLGALILGVLLILGGGLFYLRQSRVRAAEDRGAREVSSSQG